jgi:serpin B
MLVIMPDSGTFDTFLASFTPAILTEITGQLSGNLMQFSMPKFSFTKATPMASILQSLGMKSVFDQDFADLSGIDGKRDLSVSEVFHQAFIAVDEKGTEAAAATAIAFMSTTSNRFADLTVTIDHPFIFLIRDRQTGLILFMGKVVAL